MSKEILDVNEVDDDEYALDEEFEMDDPSLAIDGEEDDEGEDDEGSDLTLEGMFDTMLDITVSHYGSDLRPIDTFYSALGTFNAIMKSHAEDGLEAVQELLDEVEEVILNKSQEGDIDLSYLSDLLGLDPDVYGPIVDESNDEEYEEGEDEEEDDDDYENLHAGGGEEEDDDEEESETPVVVLH